MQRQPGTTVRGRPQRGSDSAHELVGAARVSEANHAEWWLRLIAPPPAPPNASFIERERARRGRLTGMLLLALALIEVGALFQFVVVDNDHPMMITVLKGAVALTVVVAALNRLGRVTAAALLLVALVDLPLASIPATAIGGRFDVVDLGPLYLAAGSELVAASALAPWGVFVVATLNGLLMLLIVVGMPHTAALDQLIASNNAQQAFAGPLLMQAVVALVAYLWARSVLVALKRADRAEEIAELERREVELTRELEQGARELLAVHVQLANGNFQARSPTIRNPLLWQIGSSLNNLIGRLARLAQVDFLLRRTEQEAHRVAEAIRLMRSGRQPIWPTPSGTPLDEVVIALVGAPANTGPAPATVAEAALPDWVSQQRPDAGGAAWPPQMPPQPPNPRDWGA